MPSQNACHLHQWPITPYAQAWNWQRQQVDDRKQDPHLPDLLLLLQHPNVYTLGQGSDPSFIKFAPGSAELHRIERGGEVTYHTPGQLVGYPILNLKRHKPDLHWYLRELEELLIATLAHFGLKGDRIPGMTGVWVQDRKVAAIGIKVSRWITMHGFALNVCSDLGGFGQIVPCGIEGKTVGSMDQWLPEVRLEAVQAIVVAEFSRRFNLEMVPQAAPDR
ncbi:MAG: lipoyl(octanoyl) transferase LipB [Alkalinema sp. RU_4_3]|nr:lipoyl(octanoyl) transferase LipB [Alkalinema sp. RU_4_3]